MLPIEAFYKSKRGKHGYASHCKECMKAHQARPEITERRRVYHAERYKNPKIKKVQYLNAQKPERKAQKAKYGAKYSAANKDRIAERMREYRKDERVKKLRCEASRRYNEKHREKRAVKRSSEEYLIKNREWGRKRRLIPKVKLSRNISCGISDSLRNKSKANRHWEELVDFTAEQLKQHLEKLFKPGMSWENYGTVWSIDHITPIAVFNFERPEDIDFRICWSLNNLQPLEAKANISKGARIERHFQPSLALAIGG